MNNLNPFNIAFGKEPISKISRDYELKEIYESFENNNNPSNVYIIAGARGVGKTVAMTTVANHFKMMENWIVVELNPAKDLLEQLVSKLYDEGRLKKLFLSVDFNFGFKSIGISIKGNDQILNISSFLKREFEYLKKKDIHVLITIDEISLNEYTQVFVQEFQLLVRENYFISLLMTGLYKNINSLQKEKTLTFLCRAPKIYLSKLNSREMVNQYKNIFNIDDVESIKLAKLTKGYAFSYQLLGNILFSNKKKKIDDFVIEKFDEQLQVNVYDFIYSDLTNKEKEILKLARINPTNQYILSKLKIKKNQLSNNKKTLILKGIISNEDKTKIVFNLPRFKEYLDFLYLYSE